MKTISTLLALLLLSTVAARADVPAEPSPWLEKFPDAQARAREQQRYLLLDFTGSDWCAWCHRLHDEVLSQPAFLNFARDNLVLVELDFPHNKKLPPELQEQNRKLSDRYEVTGYPTILVVSADGTVVGRLGYMQGGAKTFVRELRRLIAAAKESPVPANPPPAASNP